MAIVVYGQPDCQQCKKTARYFKDKQITFEYKDVSVDTEAYDKVKNVYTLSSLPVISVDVTEVDLSRFTEGEKPVVWAIDGEYIFTGFRVNVLDVIVKKLKR